MSLDFQKIKEYASIELLAKQLVEGFITGLHQSPYHGFSVEFAEHRLYNTGESTRHIDWKVFAKTERLYTKRYEEETNLRCQILIDVSPSMFYPDQQNNKLQFSLLASACLAYMLQKQRDAVGISLFAEEILWQSVTKSTPSHVHQLLVKLQQMLHNPPVKQKTAAAKVIHEVADKIHKRSLVVIFSDMLENSQTSQEVFSALNHLRHNQHEVLLFHVLDKKTEVDFAFSDRPYEFVDLESGEKIKIQASQVRDIYQKKANALYQALYMKCGQFKVDFITADIGKNIDQILLPYLIKRQKMK